MGLGTWLRSRLLEMVDALDQTHDTDDDEPDPDDPDSWLGLDYVHDQTLEKLKAQYETWNLVDGRLRLVLGVIGIIFAAALRLQRATAPIPFLVGVIAILAMALFLVAGILVACYYASLDFDRPPQPKILLDEYLFVDEREAKMAVIDTSIKAYDKNQDILAKKVRAFNLAFVLTAVATVLMGLAVITQIACQTASPSWWPWPGGGC